MNQESIRASQDRRSNYITSEFRTKLNPKKKNKDTQNYKPKYSPNLMSGNSQSFTTSIASSTTSADPNRISGSEISKKTTQRLDDDTYSHLSHSDGELHRCIVETPVRKRAINRVDNLEEDDLNVKLKQLPSKMWWATPLKAPSNYKPPSITMSSKSYSIVSSVSRPRVIRSAEDLRKKVISQCNQIEAIAFNKFSEPKEKQEATNTNAHSNVECVPSNELFWVPSFSFPSSSQSTMPVTMHSASPKMAPSEMSLPQHLTLILHNEADQGSNNLSHFVLDSERQISGNTFTPTGTLRSSKGVQDFSFEKTYSNQSVQYEDFSTSYKEPYFTVGDIARKHIVNPIALKLARLCTKQGQLYIDVIDDLERSCKEFEDECKNRALYREF